MPAVEYGRHISFYKEKKNKWEGMKWGTSFFSMFEADVPFSFYEREEFS